MNSLNQKRTLTIAKAVRKAAEDVSAALRHQGGHYPANLSGACGDVSVVFAELLSEIGIPVILVMGQFIQYDWMGHSWVTIDGEIWDLTATQFGAYKDKVYRCKGKYYKPQSTDYEARDDINSWGDIPFRRLVMKAARRYLKG